jgi:hypothetical protein
MVKKSIVVRGYQQPNKIRTIVAGCYFPYSQILTLSDDGGGMQQTY